MTIDADELTGRPGESLNRLARLIRSSVERARLDLRDVNVLTEAASGPYVVTPVIAAYAGATVTAVTSDSRFGSAEAVQTQTLRLAALLGVSSRITVVREKAPSLFATADIITNSGHLRPITGDHAKAIRDDAVVSLMFEKWEIQAGRIDIDMDYLLGRGISVAGTNERHADVDVFSYLGLMAAAQLADAGVSAYRSRVALLCDNPFLEYLLKGLAGAGAEVAASADLRKIITGPAPDALIVAMTPGDDPALSAEDVDALAQYWPGVIVCQFWGDVDRTALRSAGVDIWPLQDPGRGHMGVLPSRVGPEPIVRLQTGGLKVGQVLRLPAERRTTDDEAWLDV